MNRLAIFVFYDKEGIADDYVYYLLDSMHKILDKLVIVVNGVVCKDYLNKFLTNTEDVIIRENYGYDAGAYKEVILSLAENNELANWSEIVLFKDTFYGPFYDWRIIFEEMTGKNVDFWGLSEWTNDQSISIDNGLQEHVQSYFLVIRKRMLTSNAFLEFWRNLDNIYTYQDTVCNFEVMFSVYHAKHGFRYASWLNKDYICTKAGEVVCFAYPYDLIKDWCFPILKIKAISVTNFVQAGAALHYIENNYEYSTRMIWEHIGRIEKTQEGLPFTFSKIEHFVNEHDKTYIYGYGKWGHAMESVFNYKGWEIAGIIDADVTKQNHLVRRLQDVQVEPGDGVVIALGKESFWEVYPQLRNNFKREQLLLPNI